MQWKLAWISRLAQLSTSAWRSNTTIAPANLVCGVSRLNLGALLPTSIRR
jgi:hypothetical protein